MKFSRADAAVSAGALLGAAGLLYLFALDIGSVSARQGESALGTVVFKRLTATRKAPTGLGWERMRNDGPVFDGDTLRTADLSEASVYFDDGTSLDMLENTMLRLDLGGKQKNLEFLSGEISLGAGSKETSYSISSAAGRISIGSGSKATVSREADKLSVEVVKGQASLVKADGSTQSVSQYQELQVDVKTGEANVVFRPIVPVSPEGGTRFLSISAEAAGRGAEGSAPTVPVSFSWLRAAREASAAAGAAARKDASFVLELSRTKDFADAQRVQSRLLSATVSLEAGTWFWRVSDAEGNLSPERRFSLDIAGATVPTSPPEGRRYEYRRVKPTISFAWSSMAEASSYLFELSSDRGFSKPQVRLRTTATTLSVDSLGEGSWYWRVTPVHAFTVVGVPPRIEHRSLAIAKRAAMGAPSLSAPLDKTLYQVQDLDGKGLAFSWPPVDEAVSYLLVASASRDLASPLLSFETKETYALLKGGQARALKDPGAYYWGVRWKDDEGNLSPPSQARALTGFDGSIAVRLTFPPEGFRIADSLASTTRFGWKSNVPARTVFQVSRERGFEDIAYQETVGSDNIIGRAWKAGAYFWRLVAYNVDGSVLLKTPERSFSVVEPFAQPLIQKPEPGATLFLREGDSTVFSWKPVEHADYYTVTLRSGADSYASKLFEQAFVERPELSYPHGDLPSGSYKLSVQAFAASSGSTTRIIGYIGDDAYSFVKVLYLKLGAPASGDRLPGLDARRGKVEFSYVSPVKPDSAEIVISEDPMGRRVIARASTRDGKARVGRLYPGSYYWTATGKLAGFDISARERNRFVVDQPPLLPAPSLSAPAKGEVFGVDRLRDMTRMDFSWEEVEGATSYDLAVYSEDGKQVLASIPKIKGTRATIEDLSILDRGKLSWTVQASSYDAGGELEQSGLKATGDFVIDLPALKKPKSGTSGKMYGH